MEALIDAVPFLASSQNKRSQHEAEIRGDISLDVWRAVFPGLRASISKLRQVAGSAAPNAESSILINLSNGPFRLLALLCSWSASLPRRLAGDVNLIDHAADLATLLALSPTALLNLRVSVDPKMVYLRIGCGTFEFVWRVLMHEHRPYSKHLEAHPDSPLLTFLERMDANWALFSTNTAEMPYYVSSIRTRIPFLGAQEIDPVPDPGQYRDREKNSEDVASTFDCCDGCGNPQSADLKLKKCSQCKVFRFRGAECQTRAWKAGH